VNTKVYLWFGFAALVAMLVLFGAMRLIQLRSIESIVGEQTTAVQLRAVLTRELELDVIEYISSVRAVLNKERETKVPTELAAEIDARLVKYNALAENARHQELATQFQAQWSDLLAHSEKLMEEARAGREPDRKPFRDRHKRLRAFLSDKMQLETVENFNDIRNAAIRNVQSIFRFSLILSTVGLAFASTLGVTVIRYVVRYERSLLTSEERLARAQQAAGVGTWDWDLMTDTAAWTDQAWTLIGREPGAFPISTRNWLSCIHPDDRDSALAAIQQARKAGTYADEYRVVDAAGRVRWIESRGEYIYDTARKPIRMIGTIRDITERKALEETLRQARNDLERRVAERTAELQEANERLSVMAGGIAHELNQPLTAIVNYANGCVRRLDSPTGVQNQLLPVLNQIADEAHRASDLIRHLRDLTARKPPEMARGSLIAAIGEALSIIESSGSGTGTKIVRRFSEPLPPAIFDRLLITQVVLNLVHNGLEAMEERPPGKRELLIETKVNESGFLQVSVHDTGIGLTKEAAEGLFIPFRSTKPRGMGLGLVISKNIVELHGGQLWGTPRADSPGTSFHFTLPISLQESRT
jgi:signal transduction histidine kinase